MSEHAVTVRWQGGAGPFTFESYPRRHTLEFSGGSVVEASAAPDYLGDPELMNPEDALVAAIASCHMLSFLALAARKRWTVQSYRDQAVGVLAKNDEGQLAVTHVTLRPRIEFAAPEPAPESIAKLHDSAHHICFIANSVRTQIAVEPQV
jgi:organic hydroperoxide reductase OsmC/OhrA